MAVNGDSRNHRGGNLEVKENIIINGVLYNKAVVKIERDMASLMRKFLSWSLSINKGLANLDAEDADVFIKIILNYFGQPAAFYCTREDFENHKRVSNYGSLPNEVKGYLNIRHWHRITKNSPLSYSLHPEIDWREVLAQTMLDGDHYEYITDEGEAQKYLEQLSNGLYDNAKHQYATEINFERRNEWLENLQQSVGLAS